MIPLLLFFLQRNAYQAGMQAFSQHRYADAIPFFEKAVVDGTPGLVSQYMLGTACIQAHQDEKAVRAFAALFGVAPDTAAAHLLSAGMMQRANMLAVASAEAEHALALDAQLPQAHYLRGEISLAQKDAAKAAVELRQEIAANPSFAMAYYRLGDALIRAAAWDDAIAALQRSIWLNPNHSGPYTLIGKAYLERGERDEAAAALRHVLELDPKNTEAARLLARATSPDPAAAASKPAA